VGALLSTGAPLAAAHGGVSGVDAAQLRVPVSHPGPKVPLLRALKVPCAPLADGNDPLRESMTPPPVVLKLRLLIGRGGLKKPLASVKVQKVPGMSSAWKVLTPDQSGVTVKQTIPPAEWVPRYT
jgi:hypothetical protein